ncbi:MAG: T9SS type A sorting domain-containing protein [Bacteroidota bacterium]|nr:T9SS type A sorting domain-containing protein [Bacteroidota bacterium]
MKTLYSTLIATCIGVSAFAQSNILATPSANRPLNPVQKSVNPYSYQAARNANPTSTQATMSFYTDYGFMDDDFQVNTQGFTYSRYIWDMNMRYDLANGDTSLRWGTVDFNPLYDSYNGSVQIASTSYNSVTIDTIFFNAGHSNYSGTNDTILIRIVQCSAAGYPTTTALVLHTDTIISNTSITASNTWLSNGTFFTTPNFTMSNATKFAVKVEYYGNSQDTFGMTAGFGDMGIQCPANQTLPNFAAVTNYDPNSYRHDMRFAGPPNNLPQLPTSTGADTYYECDGTAGYLVGSDSENYLQNWDLWIHATVDGVGINETNGTLGVGQNYPNPATGETEIPYELKNNSAVSLTIFDVTGNEVMLQKTNANAGRNIFKVSTANLAAGVYYYTVSTTEGSITHKMVVAQ